MNHCSAKNPLFSSLPCKAGWLSAVKRIDSPNFDARPKVDVIDLLVIHNISLPPGHFDNHYVIDFFCNRLDSCLHPYFEDIASLKVSAHFLITRPGEIVQFVSTDKRAWHAGKSSFQGREQCNDFSIGIELEGTDIIPYTAQQYQALAYLTQVLMHQYPDITRDRIVGHADIAPGRKTDPGNAFLWEKYFSLLYINE